MCSECSQTQLIVKKPACFYCNELNDDGRTCKRCRAKTSLNGVLVSYRLQNPVDELVYRLKYYGDRSAAELFAPSMASLLEGSRFDMLSFVPSDGRSQRRRGYNQSLLLAKQVGRNTSVPVTKTMIRVAHTGQIGLGRQARLQSVRGNFMVITPQVAGARVVIVDDVVTTGATLNECARVLKQAGAKSVWGLAVAKR